jgi:cytochrome c oxidase accessory protein FixG
MPAQPAAAAAPDHESGADFRDHLPTVDASGHRVWLYPRKPSGRLHRARVAVSAVLLAVLVAGPFVRIGGNPLLMMNVVERRFSIAGQIFWPQDTFLFALAMLTAFVMVVLFTAVYGRIWCGWLCPQTVMMEMVFRKIEYWLEGDSKQQRALDAASWSVRKVGRKVGKQAIFFALSFVVGNLLLAYIIGSDALLAIVTDPPSEHRVGLTFMVLFSLLFYGIFARFREQACTFVCPYGRFQSVLLDANSVVVSYDFRRGEGRGRKRQGQGREERRAAGQGDCVDCRLCVEVCPTGIDIRNGTQMECVNCTACIDACDGVMDRVGFPRGLVRYASLDGIRKGEPLRLTPRLVAYTLLLVALGGFLAVLVASRRDVEAAMLRVPGSLFQQSAAGEVSNVYTMRVSNKTPVDVPLEVRLLEPAAGRVELPGGALVATAEGIVERPVLVTVPRGPAPAGDQRVVLGLYQDGRELETVESGFLRPSAQADGEPRR